MATTPSPGWYLDPSGRHSRRYWTGRRWTDSVISDGTASTDAILPGDALVPPAPDERPIEGLDEPVMVRATRGSRGGVSATGFILGGVALVVVIVVIAAILIA